MSDYTRFTYGKYGSRGVDLTGIRRLYEAVVRLSGVELTLGDGVRGPLF